MRRRGRECALQMLYQLDIGRQLVAERDVGHLDQAISGFWASFADREGGPVDREFAERLVRGVAGDLAAIDEAIGQVAQNWRLGRMSAVDRNLLRLATYEILRCPDIPRAVSINEALEIAKRFGGDESRQFVNGVLDKLAEVVPPAMNGGAEGNPVG